MNPEAQECLSPQQPDGGEILNAIIFRCIVVYFHALFIKQAFRAFS